MHPLKNNGGRGVKSLTSQLSLFEGSNAEVGQLIAGIIKFASFLTPYMASKNDETDITSNKPSSDWSMSCLASFFDAMSGVKKLSNFIPAINCPTSAFEPSFMLKLGNRLHAFRHQIWFHKTIATWPSEWSQPNNYQSMQCLTSFFYAMFGVRKLLKNICKQIITQFGQNILHLRPWLPKFAHCASAELKGSSSFDAKHGVKNHCQT